MRRVLMLCFLLMAAFANAEAAKAAPLDFGAAGFDDRKTLLENLTLLQSDSSHSFIDLGAEAVRSFDPAYVALIGVSHSARTESASTSFRVTANGTIADSYDMGAYWPPAQREYAVGDIKIGWDGSGASQVSLLDIVDGLVDGVRVSGAYFYGESLVYRPEGYEAVVFEGGTMFIGLDLGLGNEVDAILAFSPAPVNAVPVPAALWLFGSGLAGIAALRRAM